jgi:hypothetical protein
LVPRLRGALSERCDTNAPDISAIVRRLSRGDSLERLPHRTRRRWGQSITVIEDRSDRLIPYWRDQSRVRAQLARLFPRYAFEHWLYWEELAAPVWADRGGDEHRTGRLPPPGSLVIVLGDLGGLARAGQSIRRYWADLGQRLAEVGCRALALTPEVPVRYPVELRRYWQLLPWERLAESSSDAQREVAVERLLVLLSPASRIEPGLLREVRLWAGYEAATEAAFWQHPALVSDSSVAATLDAQVVRERRPAFAAEPEATKVMEMLRCWRGGLPLEVWYAEIQSLERELRERVIEPEDARQSCAFFAALGRHLKGVGGSTPPEGLADWFRFVEQRLPEDYREDPELGQYFTRLWHLAHADESQSPSTPN